MSIFVSVTHIHHFLQHISEAENLLGKAAVDILADDSYNLFSPQRQDLFPAIPAAVTESFQISEGNDFLQTIETTMNFLIFQSIWASSDRNTAISTNLLNASRNFRFMVRNVQSLYSAFTKTGTTTVKTLRIWLDFNLCFCWYSIIFS